MQDEGRIGKGSTIITDQNLPASPTPNPGTITGVKTGLGLVGGGTAGAVTVALNPGVGLTFSNGQLIATLGNSVDLNSDETVSVLPVAKGGTGLSQPPLAGAVLVGTGVGYTYGLLSDGDGTKLINASGELSYNVEATVCRTSGNCAGAGGGIVGSGTTGYLSRFTAPGNLGDSMLYDTGSAIGIGTTTPTAGLDVHAPATSMGPELVSNGGFDGNATGWDLYDCGSYANGQVSGNYTSSCSWDDVSTSVNVVTGHTYQVTFTLVSASGDQVYWYWNHSTGMGGPFSPGTQTATFTSSFTGTDTLFFEGWNWSNPSNWTIDNVSIKEVIQPAALSLTGSAGINTANPINPLDVNGAVAIGSYAGVNPAPSNGLIVSGNVGIGTIAPVSALDVEHTQTLDGYQVGLNNGLLVSPTADGSSYNEGVLSSATVPATNTHIINVVHALSGTAQNLGTGALTTLEGLHLYGSNYGNASVTNVQGAFMAAENYAGTVNAIRGINLNARAYGGTVTNQYGMVIYTSISGGAVVTNRYGLYLTNMSGAPTSSNDFVIYSDSTQKSSLTGSLALGTTTSLNKLDAKGGVGLHPKKRTRRKGNSSGGER